MEINETEVLICNCGETMPLDPKKIGDGCNLESKPKIFNSLCTNEINEFESALINSSENNKKIAVACTQQTKLFTEIAEENNQEIPYFFNIRETSGWSKSSKKASAKISSQILDAVEMLNSKNTSRSLSFNSAGRCLIYGDNERVIEVAEALSEYLGVSALLTENISIIPPTNTDFNILMGKVKNLKGYFGNFEVKIDNFAEALPHSKDEIIFGDISQDVSSECDIFIDLSGSDPLISSHEKRDGYYKVNPEDKTVLQKLILDAQTKIGEFEKPIYVNFDENLCAHSRNKITGCSKCLDVCPANAIQINGDTVDIDTAVCGGCGLCGAVCPSGAADVIWPSSGHLLNRLQKISKNYLRIENQMPKLLFHDSAHGAGIISYLSRPVSLSVRLFANMMAGHTMLKVFGGFVISLGLLGGWLPLSFSVALTGLEILVAFLQAYVFAILTCIYLNDALNLHH